ncbi:MAG: acetylxylan esterase [Flavobacteriales bacterium]|nr:acetylxylan esterase [Flavobacteriales bacterium]
MIKKLLFLAVAILTTAVFLSAQSAKEYVTVIAEPDHSDWVYSVGENASFTLYAVKENARMEGVVIDYEYGPEKLSPVFKGSVTTGKDGFAKIKVPGAKKPGFITVRVSTVWKDKKYTGMTNIGFDPYKIQPTTSLPDDFTSFWDSAKEKAAQVPMLTRITYSPEKSNDRVDVYFVRIQSYRVGNYVYGVLSVPKTEGKKPAVLRLPGAAVRSFSGPNSLAYDGFVVLEIGVHGIPVDQDPEIYSALERGQLAGYAAMGLENRDSFYYKKVYLGCVRAIDYLCSRDDVDTDKIAVYGGSQGGMLSIVTASLDKRVKAMVCHYPAFCDVTGYYYGRSGGWPHLFLNKNENNIQAKINTSKYYDTVNFARFISIPGYYAWGFNDIVCCPSSTFSAYNVIKAPKRLELALDAGHWLYPWHTQQGIDWLKNQFEMK